MQAAAGMQMNQASRMVRKATAPAMDSSRSLKTSTLRLPPDGEERESHQQQLHIMAAGAEV